MPFISTASHLGLCPSLSPCLPFLRLILTPSWVINPCLRLARRKKRKTSHQKGCPVARLQLKGESDSARSTTEKLNPFCRGECEGTRIRVILGFCVGPGIQAPPSTTGEQVKASKRAQMCHPQPGYEFQIHQIQAV